MSSDAAELFTAQTGSPAYVGFINFWSSLIIFQNIIPISLYVSIEFVKTFQVNNQLLFAFYFVLLIVVIYQAFFIWNDLDMWDEESKKSCVPKTVSRV